MGNRFKDWKVDRYCAESPDGKYCLWVANGFSFFRDYSNSSRYTQAMLIGLSLFDKWRVWREFKREMRERAFGPLTQN